jgi:hypothetical protein
MKTKIFVSKNGKGWKELRIPEFYHRYTYDALLCVIYKFIDRKQYKGLLITENPNPFEDAVNMPDSRMTA